MELTSDEIAVGTALLDSLVSNRAMSPNFNPRPKTPEPPKLSSPDPPCSTESEPPKLTPQPPPLSIVAPSSSTHDTSHTYTSNQQLLNTFKVPDVPKERKALLPTPTVKIINITTTNTKLPVKITIKIDTNNMTNNALLDNINQPVNSFYVSVDRDEQFWRLPTFFNSIKYRSATKVAQSFPVTILASSKVNYDINYTKAVYRAHDTFAVSVLNSETIYGLQHLPRPIFLSHPEHPAEIVCVFEIIIHTTYTPSSQEFVSNAQRLALTKTIDPLESIALLLAYFAKFKKAAKKEISVYNTTNTNAHKRFRQL